MSETTKDGGPAFPRVQDREVWGHAGKVRMKDDLQEVHVGMSLRDWFAGQALAGLCASMSEDRQCDVEEDSDNGGGMYEADLAYQMADRMLAAREARQ